MGDMEVIEQLNTAFKDVRRPPHRWEWKFDHEELMLFLEDLSEFDPSEVQWLLPRILIDTIERHRVSPYVSELLDVVMFLNVESSPPPAREPNAPVDYRHVQEVLRAQQSRESKERSLAYVTTEQADALLRWLELVATWDWTYEDEISAAITYWRLRAAT